MSSVSFNTRGQIASENSAAGFRNYAYSPQGALLSAQDATGTIAYTYDSANTQRMTSMTQLAVTYDALSSGNTFFFKQTAYTFDDFGRVVTRVGPEGTATFTYGANNQIANATVNGTNGVSIDYLYDESGQRLLKRKNGVLATAYTDAGVIDVEALDLPQQIDAQGLTQPIDVAGVHVGTLTKGKFVSVASDARGTVLSPWPTPYGDRAAHPATQSSTDFIEQPRDADIGLVRLGVRDYDPSTGRFVQPDSLYLQNPSLCVGDAAGCNLYSYAGNDPVNRTDPSGYLEETIIDCQASPSGCGAGGASGANLGPAPGVSGVDVIGAIGNAISAIGDALGAANNYVNSNTSEGGGNLGGPSGVPVSGGASGGIGGGQSGVGGGAGGGGYSGYSRNGGGYSGYALGVNLAAMVRGSRYSGPMVSPGSPTDAPENSFGNRFRNNFRLTNQAIAGYPNRIINFKRALGIGTAGIVAGELGSITLLQAVGLAAANTGSWGILCRSNIRSSHRKLVILCCHSNRK